MVLSEMLSYLGIYYRSNYVANQPVRCYRHIISPVTYEASFYMRDSFGCTASKTVPLRFQVFHRSPCLGPFATTNSIGCRAS